MHASNNENGKAVALLAREGAARDRLREAVISAGGRLVLESDPSLLDPQTLEAAAPSVVLVALEPAIEDALEQLEPILEAPHLTLIYDEAELAARREGWEAQRWIRHLAAKLQGHDNVLPPGLETEVRVGLEPGMPVTPAELHKDAPLNFHLEEAFDAAPAVPNDALYSSWDDAALVEDIAPVEHAAESVEVVAPESEVQSEEVPAVIAEPEPEPEPQPQPQPQPQPELVSPPVAAPAVVADFSSWSLVDDDTAVVAEAPAAVSTPEISNFLSSNLSLLELEADGAEAGGVSGAVLLLAGIGGPDAVRRLLAALPENFSRPVLVQMRLDGGRYANLVKQMARVASLPVELADPGQSLSASTIYILPEGVGLSSNEGGLRFVVGMSDQVISVLPSAESAVVMLSGSDPVFVDQALHLASEGGWVAGQIGEGCYDPEAASRLAVAGMSTGDPVYLANALAERWAA